ncbi:YaiO family outer membrane beta-barrel protein [Pseudomonas sp.]|uniref:YaiO family outer membrane beta-barrel protein n=1 Tax=Pseudomonas sp. TaxID=306 RepID=UPI00272C9410|nr:YaiO family outer membrane beta-barrel protein [Pseudomonas sp.]
MITRHLAALAAVLPCLVMASPEVARQQIEAKRLDDARATLERHLERQPADAEARFLLGQVLAWQMNIPQALQLFDLLLAEEPDNADYLLARGQALLWDGLPQEALPPLERAAAIAPDYEAVQHALRQARASFGERPTTATAAKLVQPSSSRKELELTARQDWLDSGFDNWRAQRLDYSSSRAEGLGWYGALLREQRFGESDDGLELGALIPLGGAWTLQPELGYQRSPSFQPEWFADVRVQRILPAGFVGAASVRRTEYQSTRVDRLALAAERYWGSWRAGYTLNITDVANAGTPVGHNLALDHFYDGLSYVGVRLVAGDEEAVEEQQLITSSVRAVSLQGRHWLSSQWALGWEVGHHRQGSFYERNWLQLGVRHAF